MFFVQQMANNENWPPVAAPANSDVVRLLHDDPEDANDTAEEPGALHQHADESGASWLMSSFIVTNAALGAGILNFPAAFDTAGGIVAATVVHVVSGFERL
jgi:hypothetical protein